MPLVYRKEMMACFVWNNKKIKLGHSTETRNQGWSIAHEERIWIAAEAYQHIPLSSTPVDKFREHQVTAGFLNRLIIPWEIIKTYHIVHKHLQSKNCSFQVKGGMKNIYCLYNTSKRIKKLQLYMNIRISWNTYCCVHAGYVGASDQVFVVIFSSILSLVGWLFREKNVTWAGKEKKIHVQIDRSENALTQRQYNVALPRLVCINYNGNFQI